MCYMWEQMPYGKAKIEMILTDVTQVSLKNELGLK